MENTEARACGTVGEAAMSPDVFASAMRVLSLNVSDPEARHSDMDDLLCVLLRRLGYGDGIDVFENTHKWYA